jgi:UDP-glucose 4-epimerase
MTSTILVTGGLGFIGSHTCVELLNQGHNVIIVDNLQNSKLTALDNILQLTCDRIGWVKHCECDLTCYTNVDFIFQSYVIDLVIHFAGLKSVNESVENPLLYYADNITMTTNLLKCMSIYNCKKIIFSSSATVYGDVKNLPIKEIDEIGQTVTNPYGKTKYIIEQILQDLYISDKSWSIVILRYFNPVGAHESGLLGENPNNIPNNLMPYLLDVAIKKRDILHIYGNTYETPDGTCIRDFIHVVDLAEGHICAIKKTSEFGVHVYNLGSGIGTSVLELVTTFIAVTNQNIPYEFSEKRLGDVRSTYTDPSKAYVELGWITTRSITHICKDSWNYIVTNTNQNI